MADLDVQPKKQSGSLLPWILLGLGILALLIFLARGCDADVDDNVAATTDSAANTASNAANNTAGAIGDWWDDVDFNAPDVKYDEVTDKDVNVRGNDRFGIYAIGEDILFDVDKSTIRPQGEAKLKQIVASIDKRYGGANVRVYGHTDAVGSAGYNKELAEQRAQAVRDWLVKSGNVAEGRLSIHAVGEGQPVASNATEQGRQQNRRVEIVAGGGSGAPR